MDMPLLARIRAIAGGILLAAALSGCDFVASLDAPLPATEEAKVEEGLVGIWVDRDSAPDFVSMLSVEEAEGETLIVEWILTAYNPENRDNSSTGLPFLTGTWRATPSVVGARTYYSGHFLSYHAFFPEDHDSHDLSLPLTNMAKRDVYHVGRAEIDAGGELTLAMLTERDIRSLDFATTKLDGITYADPEQLRDLIAANADGDIFSYEHGTFVRISGAPSPDEPAEVPAEAPKQ